MKLNYYIIILCIVLFTFSSCNFIKKEKKNEPYTVPVEVLSLESQSLDDAFNFVGVIEESSSIILSFETGGNITSINVHEGQYIPKGHLVATIDNRTSQRAYDLSKATLEQAIDGYNRAEQVYKNGSLTEIKWIEVQTQLSQARSMADISFKKLQDCNLFSPSSGVISERNVETGMNVLPYQPCFKLVDISKVKLAVGIPENEISKINIGQKAVITVPAIDDAIFYGKVSEKGIVADPLSHSYQIKIDLDNKDKKLMPGMISKVSIQTGKSRDVFLVPMTSVQLSNNGMKYVWTIEDGKAKMSFIEVQGSSKDKVVVISGLSSKDLVITSGYNKLSVGTIVEQR